MLLRILIFFLLTTTFASCKKSANDVSTLQHFSLIEDSSLQLNAAEIWAIHQNGNSKKVNDQYVNIGFTKSVYWLVVSIKNYVPKDSLVLHVGDPHINQLHFYSVQNNVPNLQAVSGDYYKFSQRPFQIPGYFFPVNYRGNYLVKIDKHHESLQLYFGLQPLKQVLEIDKQDTAIAALFTGMILLLVVFGFFMLAISKDLVYLHYIFYILAIWIYILAGMGYGFQYLWPNDPWFASKARPVLLLLTIVLSMRFMEFYIGGIQHQIARRLLHAFGLFLLLFMMIILLGSYAANASNAWLYMQYVIPIVASLYILFSLVLLIAKAIKGNYLATFYLVAIGSILVISVFQLLYYSGSYNAHFYGESKFATAIGVVIEIMIITAGMAFRFNQYRQEKELLLVQINKQQQENTRTLMEVQEAERNQIANQLHDVAGSLLSAAKLNLSSLSENGFSGTVLEKTKIVKAEEAVSIVSETVRNLSHALSPIMLQKAGLKTSLEKIVSIFNASGKINIELLMVGFENPAFLQTYYVSIYSMVYELLNNVVKHSQASHALVQVIEHEDGFTIMVEDDGIGLTRETIENKSNNGLAGIVSKVKYYNGEIAFDSNGTGLITTIELPI